MVGESLRPLCRSDLDVSTLGNCDVKPLRGQRCVGRGLMEKQGFAFVSGRVVGEGGRPEARRSRRSSNLPMIASRRIGDTVCLFRNPCCSLKWHQVSGLLIWRGIETCLWRDRTPATGIGGNLGGHPSRHGPFLAPGMLCNVSSKRLVSI